jgi:hypothetical protein
LQCTVNLQSLLPPLFSPGRTSESFHSTFDYSFFLSFTLYSLLCQTESPGATLTETQNLKTLKLKQILSHPTFPGPLSSRLATPFSCLLAYYT